MGIKMGGAGLVIGVVALLLTGEDIFGVLESGGPASQIDAPGEGQPYQPTPEEQELTEFVSFVLDDVQDEWAKIFEKQGRQYQPAKLVLFTDQVRSACGFSSAAVGPFYCPGDQKAYIDLGFYRQLKQRFGAPGDFAQAYVLAHEIAHHVQTLEGTSAKLREISARDPRSRNGLSVRQELQADCYAGVWGHSAAGRQMLETGDVEEGLRAAAAIGDDTLQKQSGQRVQPESWTHGSSEMRVRWFRKGLETGDPSQCDTFKAPSL